MVLDLNQFLVKDEPEDFSPEVSPTREPIDVSRYLVKEPETMIEAATRQAARTGSRIAETVLGLPGDLIQLAKTIGMALPGAEEQPTFIQRLGQQAIEKVPTSSDLQRFSEKITSDYTKAQNPAEEFSDDVFSLASGLFIGGGGGAASKGKVLMKGLKSVGKALSARTARKGAELLGAGEKGQLATEIGTLFAIDLVSPKMVDKFVGDLFNSARSEIKPGTLIRTAGLEQELNRLGSEFATEAFPATTADVGKSLTDLSAKASGGAMPISDLVGNYHQINMRMTARGLYDGLGKREAAVLRRNFEKYRRIIGNTIEDYGRQSNPEFLKRWKEAKHAYGTMAESRKLGNFIARKIDKIPSHLYGGIALELIGGAAFGHPVAAASAAGITLAGVGVGRAALNVGESLIQISKDAKLSRYYRQAITAASQEKLPDLIRNLEKLQAGLEEK